MTEHSKAAKTCERCVEQPWTQLWSPDGLCGHELLVCDDCWSELDREADVGLVP